MAQNHNPARLISFTTLTFSVLFWLTAAIVLFMANTGPAENRDTELAFGLVFTYQALTMTIVHALMKAVLARESVADARGKPGG